MGPASKNVKTHDTPAASSKILHADEDGANKKHAWNYHVAVGCLSYLQEMTLTQPHILHPSVCAFS